MHARILSLLALAAVVVVAQEDTVVTKVGTVVGTVSDRARAFRGVPFAQPPQRWQSPVPVTPFGTLKTQEDKPGCWQNCELPTGTCPPTMSEDCLYLNVFTPRKAHLSEPVPVMVFIHGGNFKQGYAGGQLYDGTTLSNRTSVITVVIQYRLGSLGYLYNGAGAMGNYGMQDQVLALQWVAENIAAFGGDTSRITLFGQSAGAMSTAALMSSPAGKGLFNHAIMESEPFGLPFRTPDTWKAFASAFTKDAGCTDGDDSCLLALSAEDIIAAQVKSEKDLLASITHLLEVFLPWTPTAETNLLPYQPWQAFVQGATHDVPIIIGTVENEGWEFIYEAFAGNKTLSSLELDVMMDFVFGLGHDADIKKQYPPVSGDNRPVASKIATDALFVCASRNATLAGPVANKSPVWLYHFNHIMSFSKAVWGPQFAFCDDKVCHAEELVFVFGGQNATMGVVFDADEVVLSDSMQTYWSTFAYTGNPNPASKPAGLLEWPQLSDAEVSLEFKTPANGLLTKPYTETCQLWNGFGYRFP